MNYVDTDSRHIKMARTAGIISFVSMGFSILGTIIFPFILSPISLILAILSKGKTKAFTLWAKLAVIISIIALIINSFFTAFGVYMCFFDTTYQTEINEMMQEYYGMSLDEFKDSLKTEFNNPYTTIEE